MYISSKGEYGVRALFDLAQHYGSGPVASEAIATRQSIPPNYLNQVLILLRKAGLIESVRGPQGGHMLAHPPHAITILDIIRTLEGPFVSGDGACLDSVENLSDDRAIICEVWMQLRAAIEAVLGGMTLDDMCQRKRARTGQPMYFI